MTDKEFRRVEKLINRLMNKWKGTLGFNRWKIRVTVYQDYNEDNRDCAAKCNAMWEYQDVWLRFYAMRMVDMSDKEIEEIFVHEMCHALVNQMREWSADKMYHEEHVVTMLTQALMWTRYDGLQEGRRQSKSGLKSTKRGK